MKTSAPKKALEIIIEALVEKYIKETEEDIVTQDPLIKIFITPFTDVLRTAKGELEKNIAIGASTIVNLAKQAAVLAIPFFASSMIDDIQEESQAKLDEKLSKINSRYADVLKRNWDTVRGRDVWGITFMLDPSFGIAEKFILRAPYAALGILEVLTGGNSKVTELKELARKLVHHVTPSYLSSVGASTSYGGGGSYGGFGGDFGWGDWGGFDGGFGESVDRKSIVEQQAQQQTKPNQQQKSEMAKRKLANAIIAAKSDRSIQQALQTSPVAKQLQTGALEAIQEVIKPVLSATSYEQLKTAIGPQFNKFEQEYLKTLPQELKNPEKIKNLQQQMVPHLKQIYKSVLITQLKALSQSHPSISKQMAHVIQQINKN